MWHNRLEIEDETKTVKQAVKHGYMTRKLAFIGIRGAPDRLFGRGGNAMLIEFKRRGEVPSSQQLKRHEELRSVFGFVIYWADSYEEACKLLGIPA